MAFVRYRPCTCLHADAVRRAERARRSAGLSVTLTLADGAAGPVEHAQALFKRAAKQRRASQQLRPLLAEAEAQLEYVLEVQESLVELDR